VGTVTGSFEYHRAANNTSLAATFVSLLMSDDIFLRQIYLAIHVKWTVAWLIAIVWGGGGGRGEI
jgi:hypothetical protein